MNSAQAITVKAFLTALSCVDSIPDDLQTNLHKLAETTPFDFGELHSLGQQSPLKSYYQKVRQYLQKSAAERSKCDFPILDKESEARNTEVDNIVKVVESKTLEEEEVINILAAEDSVKMVKQKFGFISLDGTLG